MQKQKEQITQVYKGYCLIQQNGWWYIDGFKGQRFATLDVVKGFIDMREANFMKPPKNRFL